MQAHDAHLQSRSRAPICRTGPRTNQENRSRADQGVSALARKPPDAGEIRSMYRKVVYRQFSILVARGQDNRGQATWQKLSAMSLS